MVYPLGSDPTAPPPVSPPDLITLAPGDGGAPAAGRPAGPDAALAELLAGNARFVSGRPRYGHAVTAARAVATGATPHAAVVGCLDPRVPVEAIFDQDFGAVAAVRSAGHVLDRVALASVEFAVSGLGVDLVMVLGHTRCAAVYTAVEAWRTGRGPQGHLGYVVDEIRAAIRPGDRDHDHDGLAEEIVRRHTGRSVERLRGLLGDRVPVVGARYDVDSGTVELV